MFQKLATIVAVYTIARLLLSVLQYRPAKDDPGGVKAWIAVALVAAIAIILIAVQWKDILSVGSDPIPIR